MKMDRKKHQLENLRPPIVTILGHVDHGKTTLLDAIRKTNFVAKEAGGITQSTGTSQVATKEGKKITFIDTPGHAAFAKMRSRGAKVADIAVLVVSLDRGVKPQTKEALSCIKEEAIPYIVVFSKSDLTSADIKKVQGQLESEGVSFEGAGGDVPKVKVSAKTGTGIDNLIELISLVAEVNEIKGDSAGELEAVVVETSKDKKGPLATIVVRNGTVGVGDEIVADNKSARVRGIFDHKDKPTRQLYPGDPGSILGFKELPAVGTKIQSDSGKEIKLEVKKSRVVLEKAEDRIPVVIKTQNAGSLEDLLGNLPEEIQVILSGVGDVNESDVFMAKSSHPARIFVFEAKVSTSVKRLADTEGVKIERFEVIYELFDKLEELIEQGKEKILGEAEIITEFPYDNKKVAGCKVAKGRIDRSDKLTLVRGDEELGSIKVVSMKKQKQDVSVAKEGEEFGLIFSPQLDFKAGDMILSVRN